VSNLAPAQCGQADEIREERRLGQAELLDLLTLGGFPEPFFGGREHR